MDRSVSVHTFTVMKTGKLVCGIYTKCERKKIICHLSHLDHSNPIQYSHRDISLPNHKKKSRPPLCNSSQNCINASNKKSKFMMHDVCMNMQAIMTQVKSIGIIGFYLVWCLISHRLTPPLRGHRFFYHLKKKNIQNIPFLII